MPGSKQFVRVEGLEDPSAFGYSPCVRIGQTVHVAGQCGLGLDHEVVSAEFEPQARAQHWTACAWPSRRQEARSMMS